MLGHDAGPAAQHRPGQQRAQQGVADARPGGRNAVLPSKLSGVAHEDHGGEIRSAVGESGEPGAHRAPAQHKSVHIRGVAAAVQADAHHHAEEHDQHTQFDDHSDHTPKKLSRVKL